MDCAARCGTAEALRRSAARLGQDAWELLKLAVRAAVAAVVEMIGGWAVEVSGELMTVRLKFHSFVRLKYFRRFFSPLV